MSYDREPRYPAHGPVVAGYGALAEDLRGRAGSVLAIDGPAALPWETLQAQLAAALATAGVAARFVDIRGAFSWQDVQERTAGAVLKGDPVFGRYYEGALRDLLPAPPEVLASDAAVTIVFGPGSAVVDHLLLWYADVPKRLSLEALRRGAAGNVGQPPGEAGSEQRLLFVDWPMLDRHKQALLPSIDRFVDLTHADEPRSLAGEALREALNELADGPFRTRPTFLPGPWGGQWLREQLRVPTDEPNLAWSYELITPESGILLGAEETLEVGFELLMAAAGERIVGAEVAARFGRSFPIRFDYLDTLDGGHLSIQCHPSESYMRDTFGLGYTQHETYYVMETTPDARVFLGLQEDADVDAFREAARAAAAGTQFEPERFVQAHPAEQHQLYLIPAGTPHASGAGNVVLEISATPYLYTLRFYDWLRRDLEGALRPVHLDHAFANLDPRRRGAAVREQLIQDPRPIRGGDGWVELSLGERPELFFAIHRLDFDEEVEDDTGGRFHVLNLVAGDEATIETAAGRSHRLSYAETVVVPATVGPYRITRASGSSCKVVKAFVK